jgi:hypothetical protein
VSLRLVVWTLVVLLAGFGGNLVIRQRRVASLRRSIVELRKEQEALEARFREAAPSHDPLGLSKAPAGAIIIGLPGALDEELLTRAVMEVLGKVRIRLTNLHVHHEDDVTARVLFGEHALGHFVIDLDLPELKGTVRPGKPSFTFAPNRVNVALSVSIVNGTGHGEFHVHWGAKGVSHLVCGNVDAAREIAGTIRPGDYAVGGGFALAADGDDIVATPQFGDVVVKIKIDPSPDSWAFVDEVVAGVAQDRNGLCRVALHKVDVPAKVREVLDQGFDVHLPREIFRPVRLPVAVAQSVEINGKAVSIEAHPTTFLLTPHILWFGESIGAAPTAAAAANAARVTKAL